ncbi:MAG: hypothetical protein M3155_09820, partial [Actinomycetota bacterium]|nr:hypothetical protein [Actinomycetota bacterium]
MTAAALTDPRLSTRWHPGHHARGEGPFLVSFTEFTFRYRDLPAIAWAGMRLRRALRELEGAEGMALYVRPLSHRSGSVSAWRDEEALREFIRLPYHVEIMRRYRRRGTLRAARWESERFSLREALAEAARRVPDDPALADHAARILAPGRMAIGLGAWLAPRTVGRRMLGLDDTPQLPLLARIFGVRDLALGVGTLTSTGRARRTWLGAGVACDVADVAATVA